MEEMLNDIEAGLSSRLKGKRIALIGIGNIDKGDDGFGPRLVKLLHPELKNTALFDCGTSPENFLGPILRSKPEVILLVDAANLGAEPGHTHIIEKEEIANLGLSTHDTSLKLFIAYLENGLDTVDIFLLGIQPKDTSLGSGLSRELEAMLPKFKKMFLEALS